MAPLPIDAGQLAPFLVAVALIELTPGPNMGYLSLVAARDGRIAGWFTVLGVTLGLAVYMLASAVGPARVAAAHPWVYHSLRWAGVGYLLWLALDAWRGAPAAGGIAGTGRSPLRHFARGFIANVLNPKAAVFYISLLPSFIRPERGDVVRQTLALGAVHLAVSVVVHGAIVLLAGMAHAPLLRVAQARTARAGFGLALLGVAGWVAWSTRAG